MTIENFSPKLVKLANDVCFLTEHTQCPSRQRALLRYWTTLVRGCKKSAFREELLVDVVDALVTLSHSNATFSRTPTPPFHRGKSALDIDDRGGYFAGRQAIAALIRSVPIREELRLLLAQRVLTRIDQDIRGLEGFIPIS